MSWRGEKMLKPKKNFIRVKTYIYFLVCLVILQTPSFTRASNQDFNVAREIKFQPLSIDIQLQIKNRMTDFSIVIFSEIDKEVFIKLDSSIVPIGEELTQPIHITANVPKSIHLYSYIPGKGKIILQEMDNGKVHIIPYNISLAKQINQGVAVSYYQNSNLLNLIYNTSHISQAPSEPSWNTGIGVSLNTLTGQASQFVTFNFNW